MNVKHDKVDGTMNGTFTKLAAIVAVATFALVRKKRSKRGTNTDHPQDLIPYTYSTTNIATSNNTFIANTIFLDKNDNVVIRLNNGKEAIYSTPAAKFAYASLVAYGNGTDSDHLALITKDIDAMVCRLMVTVEDLIEEPRAARAICLLMRAEIAAPAETILNKILQEYETNPMKIPNRSANYTEWLTRVPKAFSRRVYGESMCYSGDPILLIAETLKFILSGLKLDSGSAINLPLLCSTEDHDAFLQRMKDLKEAGECCKLTGSELTLGVEFTPGSITPTSTFKNLGGIFFRKKWEEKIQKNVKNFFKREEEVAKSSQRLDLWSKFTMKDVPFGNMGFLFYAKKERLLLRGSILSRGQHIILYTRHCKFLQEDDLNDGGIICEINDDSRRGLSTVTKYRVENRTVRRIDNNGNSILVKVTCNPFSEAVGQAMNELGYAGRCWKLAVDGDIHDPGAQAFAVMETRDIIAGSIINTGGNAINITMRFPGIKHDDGTLLKVAHCTKIEGEPLILANIDNATYELHTLPSAEPSWSYETIVGSV